MHRRTIYVDQLPELEDILLQEKYVLQAISALASALIGPNMAQAGVTIPRDQAGRVIRNGLWLPGPYTEPPDVGDVQEIYGIQFYKDTGLIPRTVTVNAPLALVQSTNMDAPSQSSWSTFSRDNRLFNIIGFLESDKTFQFAGPASGYYRVDTIIGTVVAVDAGEVLTPFYNPSDKTTPLLVSKSRERQSQLVLSIVAGTATNNPPNKTLPGGGSTIDIDAMAPGIPLQSAPLCNVYVVGGVGGTSIYPHVYTRSSGILFDRHHAGFRGGAPPIRVYSDCERYHFTAVTNPLNGTYDGTTPKDIGGGTSIILPIQSITQPPAGILDLYVTGNPDTDATMKFEAYVKGVATGVSRLAWFKSGAVGAQSMRMYIPADYIGFGGAVTVRASVYDPPATEVDFTSTGVNGRMIITLSPTGAAPL